MAKTKMIAQVETLLKKCKVDVDAAYQSIEYAQKLYMANDAKALEAVKSVHRTLGAYQTTVGALDQELGRLEAHLAKWNADTKLKNIFKDKAKLRASKQEADKYLAQAKADVNDLKGTVRVVLDVATKIQIDM